MAKILIADDSSFMRKVLSDLLTEAGYSDIVQASDGKQAVEQYNSNKPDLVLMDVIMPEMDGVTVLKEIVPKGAKVIMISAVGQDDMIHQATDAGAIGYIVKPFDEKKVLEEVKKALD
jgi:two-component system chemotaxis response regulator CheY